MNIPNTSSIENIIKSITTGAKSNCVAHLIKPALAPENAKSWEKVAEPKIISNAIVVTFNAPVTEFLNPSQVNLPYRIANPKTPKQPKAADSDGVAHPFRISSITPTTIDIIGRTSIISSFIFLPQEIFSTS